MSEIDEIKRDVRVVARGVGIVGICLLIYAIGNFIKIKEIKNTISKMQVEQPR